MNKSQKLQKCREILNNATLGERINLEDSKFLWKIFEGHEHWEQKRGCGIKYFTVEKSDYKNRCFFIYRKDGSKTDISFHQSITKRDKLTELRIACRSAIKNEILEFKNNVKFGQDKCPFTGEILYRENTHIDHYDLTFEEVFQLWIKGKKIEELISCLNEGGDMSMEVFFTDDKIVKDFKSFHNKHTHLRAISKIANISILRKNEGSQR